MTITGLSSREAAARLAQAGPNALPAHNRRTFARLVVEVVREPMFALLLASTAIYLVLGDLHEAATLGGFVFVVVGITIAQERRTDRALDALRELAAPRATARRDGAWISIDARALVPGDVILLGEGERVPADARLRDGAAMSIDESLLTGESVPVVKLPGDDAVFAGTLVGAGHGIAEVTATGARSQLGTIGAALGGLAPSRTPLEREIRALIAWIAAIAVVLSAALVLIRGLAGAAWLDAALAGLTLAMSLLPEELPVILTVFLALGAWRIARQRVLARHASAIETLGAVTVLCVDKTGTLTQNRMTVQETHGDDDLLAVARLACPREPIDPMDRAFAARAPLDAGLELVREHPLRAGLLAVTNVWRDRGGLIVASKGSPETIFELCRLAGDELASWRAKADEMAERGLRVLGVARATAPAPADDPRAYALSIVGVVGLADPIRADAAETVARCRAAGIRLVMITGDHPATARAIATAAGIPADDVLTGAELDALDDHALAARLATAQVIARAVPAHKLRIVQALRARGDVVGMTGDGVNDAPALAASDIGIAMGARGTDVAREAADLVLVDDDLGAIVGAVGTGRRIYDNIRKAVGYTLAVHVPIAGLALLPPLFGWGAILSPIHVVFLELIIDPACGIVFEREPEDPGTLARPPRRPGGALFGGRALAFALARGAAVLVAALAVIAWARAAGHSDGAARALGFVALVAGNLALLVAQRGGSAPFWRRRARNGMALALVGGTIAMVALVLAVPFTRALFAFAPVSAALALAAAAAAAAPVLAADALKIFRPASR